MPALRFLLSLAVVLPALFALPALAASGCGGVVQDPDDLLSVSEEADVAAAADRLAAVGVRPLVVVTETTDGMDPEDVLASIITSCAGLTDAEGEWGGNVLGVIVAPDDRQTGIFEGGALPALDVTETNVDLDVMNPRFAEGDLAGGLVAGLDRMTAIQADADTVDDSGASGSGVPWLLGGVVATGAAGAGGSALLKRRKFQAARADAHAVASSTQADIAQKVIDLERSRDVVRLDGRRLADRLGVAEATPLREEVQATTGVVDSVVTRWFGLTGQMGPVPKADVETYKSLAEQMQGMEPLVDEAGSGLSALAERLTHLEQVEAGLTDRIAALGPAHAEIEAALVAAEQRYRTEPAREDLALSIAATARAREAHAENLVSGADDHLDLAEAAAKDARTWVGRIEEMRTELSAELGELRERRNRLIERVGQVRPVMEAMEAAYAPSAYEDVAGNGSEAESEIAFAGRSLESSAEAQSMDVQDWTRAEESLDDAEVDLDDATRLLDAIEARAEELADAAQILPSVVPGAVDAARQADVFASGRAADVADDVEGTLRSLVQRASQLAQAVAEGGRQDPRSLLAQAQQIQGEATELRTVAEQQVTAADMARRRAERALIAVRGEIESMRTFVSGRTRYAGATDRRIVAEIISRFTQVEVISDPIRQEAAAARLLTDARAAMGDIRRRMRRARDQSHARSRPSGGFGGGFGGGLGGSFGGSRSSGSRSSGSRSSGSSSRSRSRRSGSSSRSRSSSGRRRSGRSSRW